jgi:ABC-type uncharacterized transport system substrate-binding protein
MARDLVATKPDVVMAVSAALAAMKEASSTLPIVAFGPDPVAQGSLKVSPTLAAT